jgi:hypothetical protein
MVCLFYLAAFYSTMTKRRLIIKGVDILETLRSVSVDDEGNKTELVWLSKEWFLSTYISLIYPSSVLGSLCFIDVSYFLMAGAMVFVIVFFAQDVQNHNRESSERLTRAVCSLAPLVYF